MLFVYVLYFTVVKWTVTLNIYMNKYTNFGKHFMQFTIIFKDKTSNTIMFRQRIIFKCTQRFSWALVLFNLVLSVFLITWMKCTLSEK